MVPHIAPPAKSSVGRVLMRRVTMGKKVAGIIAVIMIVAAANIVVVRHMVNDLNGVAETINVAGRLRMLSQKIAFETMRSLYDPVVQPMPTMQEFDAGLRALSSGGGAFGYQISQVAKPHMPELSVIRTNWMTYQAQVFETLARKKALAVGTEDIAELSFKAAAVLNGVEALVAALTSEAHQLQDRALMQLYYLLLLDIAILLLVFLVMRRHLIDPLRDLAQRSYQLANGLGPLERYQSRDELGQLAEALDQAFMRIGVLIGNVERERNNIKQAESMFRALAANTVVGVYIAQNGAFSFANSKMAHMFGYGLDEMTSSVKVADIVEDEGSSSDALMTLRHCKNRDKQDIKCEVRARRKDGSHFDIEVFGSHTVLDGKRSTIGIILDITERKQIDRALRVLVACNQALVHATEDSALLAEITRIVQQISGYPFVWVGYVDPQGSKNIIPVAVAEAQEGALRPMLDCISWDESEYGRGSTGTAVRTGRTVVAQDIQNNPHYAQWRSFLVANGIVSAISLPLKAGNATLGALTVYSRQIDTFIDAEVRIMEELTDNLAYGLTALRSETERRIYAEQLEYNANHDSLTGLANRARLADRLRYALSMADRSGRMVAVMLLDLDHFKVINDSMGHAAGDALLQAVSMRLNAVVRKLDTVARLGGDEFVIVMPDMLSADRAAAVAEKILEQMSQPFRIAGKEIHVGVSIGISLYPHDGTDDATLLQNVDQAMYRVKQSGRANFHFYTEEMNAHNQEHHALQTALHFALSRGELLLHYQPKVDLHSRKIVGVEALIRWQHPQRGLILPERFIPLAEATGMIVAIGAWVIRTACQQNVAWQAMGIAPINMAVNLSAWQFHRYNLVGLIDSILRETGLHPQYLDLELTESVIIQEANEAIPALMGLKALGVQLSLDDFGTGYSSLTYLRQFPFDNLKIDRSFIVGMSSSTSDTTIVKAVIDLAHNLNLKVIAEGVETLEEINFLDKHACDEIQGYYFSKPLPHNELLTLLEAGHCSGALEHRA